jgi:3-deoxy-D-manno-octulosonic-acid transferase
MLFFVLYTFFLHLLAFFTFPYFLYQRIKTGKYKNSIKSRLGLNIPKIDKGQKYLIWVHAVSVGETKAIKPLVKLIRKDKPDAIIVFSNITETGHREALEGLREYIDHALFLPFDLPYIIKPIVHSIKPNLVLITETDFWYHFQSAAKECGADIITVNGKLSEKSLKRYSILPWLTAPIFHSLDFICVQSASYKRRFLELGIPPDHLEVTGNLKLDDIYDELSKTEEIALKNRLGLSNEDKLLVIGSTHDNEEKLILNEIKKVWRRWPNLKVLLVPRHPERFNLVASLLDKQLLPFARWSKDEKFTFDVKIMLVDTMGVLRNLYQISDIALVAGSFTDKVGGHNLLEPSWYSKPVIWGPYIYSQRDFAALINQKEAGLCIDYDDIASTVHKLLSFPEISKEMGKQGKKIFDEAKGATERTWSLIQKIAF